MKMCPNCRNQIPDDAVFCPICGNAIGITPQFQPQPATQKGPAFQDHPVSAPQVPYVDPYDHTKAFSAGDISEHKVAAMLTYLLGPLGIIIALLVARDSRFIAFHVKQAMKLTVAEILGLLALTVVSFLLWGIRLRVFMLFVIAAVFIGLILIHLLCFLQVCKGCAKEAYLVRNLKFLQ